VTSTTPTIVHEPVSREKIIALSGEILSTCFQCQKCSNGCPLVFAMDIAPHRLIHSIQLGRTEEVLNSDTIWVCASCETCTTRCPNDIDIAHLMDTLRQISMKRGVKESQKRVPVFHAAFLSSVKRFGRMHEASMALTYAYRSGGIKGVREQFSLGLEMLRKGKIKPIPGRLTAGKEVNNIFHKVEKGGQS
jgi:heterodisulfide reductase subunit C